MATRAFKGKGIQRPIYCDRRSTARRDAMPMSSVATNNVLSEEVRNIWRAMCGTTSPIKPIGPQKAVVTPARSAVARNKRIVVARSDKPSEVACAAPSWSKESGRKHKKASISPSSVPNAKKRSDVLETSLRLPIVQMTKSLSACSLLVYCKMFTTPNAKALNNIPNIRIVFCPLRRIDATRISSSIANAPSVAAPAMVSAPIIPPPPLISMTHAAPSVDPELMPSTNGPARGLRKKRCIRSPLVGSAIPTNKAVSILGKRYSQNIFRRNSDGGSPKNVCKSSSQGREIAPKKRSATASSSTMNERQTNNLVRLTAFVDLYKQL